MTKCFRFYVDGFYGTFTSLDALKARIVELKTRYPDLVGKICTVTQGERHGEVEYYPGNCPRRELVISAA